MQKRTELALLIFTAVLSVHALGAPKPIIPPTLTLKAKAGDFDEWRKPVDCKSGHLLTTITVSDLKFSAQWPGGARVWLYTTSDDERTTFGVQPGAFAGTLTTGMMKIDHTGKETQGVLFDQALKMDSAIPLEIIWTPHQIDYYISGQLRGSLAITRSIKSIRLMGVGATVTFNHNQIDCELVS